MRIQNVRFIIAAITTFSAFAVYVSRVNLSIAIIAMVEDHHLEDLKKAELNSIGGSTTGNSARLNHPNSSTSDVELLMAYSDEPQNKQNISSANSGAQNQNQNQKQKASLNLTLPQDPDPFAPIFLQPKKSVEVTMISKEKFNWNQAEQGHILGAFFYGYILFQIPGARMAESVGAKWIIMAASTGSAVISLAFPLSTQLNSIHLLMVLRFVMGLCQSAFFPAAYGLFCRWLPESERSVLLPLMFLGSNLGSISTYITSSYLISSSYGWPSVFYLSGLICLLCSTLWCIVGSNGPHDNWLITEQERKFIERNVDNETSESNSFDGEQQQVVVLANHNNNNNDIDDDDDNNPERANHERKKLTSQNGSLTRQLGATNANTSNAATTGRVQAEASWSKLIKSVPVWTLILSMYGNEWSNVVICYELPTYLNTALGFPIEQNGVINSFFQLSYTVASPIMSSLGAYMLDRHLFGMRKIHVRKLFQSLSTFGQLACFVSVPICGANRGLIILLMFSAIIFRACCNAGDLMVPGDLSPEYAGTLFAFANSFGNTAGFFAPSLAGFFVANAYDREQWAPFWLTTATIMGCSGLVFLAFGETRRQDFSNEKNEISQLDELTLSSKVTETTGRNINEKIINNNKTKTRTSII